MIGSQVYNSHRESGLNAAADMRERRADEIRDAIAALSAQSPLPAECPGCAMLQRRLDAVSMLAGNGFFQSLHDALDAKGAPRGDGEGITYGLVQRIQLIPHSPPPADGGEA